MILSKAKGWYIVQKDPDGMGKIVPDQALSGWVPAGTLPVSSKQYGTYTYHSSGCLLELSSPVSIVSPAATENVPAYPGLLPLAPSAVMSSSYPGVALMDYQAKGEGELSLREGDTVKVYKKYCHWSYTSVVLFCLAANETGADRLRDQDTNRHGRAGMGASLVYRQDRFGTRRRLGALDGDCASEDGRTTSESRPWGCG